MKEKHKEMSCKAMTVKGAKGMKVEHKKEHHKKEEHKKKKK